MQTEIKHKCYKVKILINYGVKNEKRENANI